mgnify:CR=1 FL=1
MKKIQKFKPFSLAIYTAVLCLLAPLGYASTYNMAVNPHFCLTNNSGKIQAGCTGPTLNAENITIFMPFFKNNPSYTPMTSSQALNTVPRMDTGAGRVIDNMIPLVINSDPSLGSANFNPVLTNWQYVNKVIYFGNSTIESQVLLPTPGWIRAAHQNHAAILGTLLIEPSNISPSNINLLIQVAKTYGIDGYFINTENLEKSSSAGLQQFINTIQTQSKTANYPLKIDTSANSLISSELNKNEQQLLFNPIISPGSTAQTLRHSFEEQNQSESNFWQSSHRALLEAGIPQDFKILLPLSPPPSPSINPDMTYSLPFNTYFNTGMGYDYYINGRRTGLGIWSDIGLQDLLPNQYNPNMTYQYSPAPKNLNIQQDPLPQTTNPYYGGSVLNVALNPGPMNSSALLYANMNLNLKSLDNPTLVIAYQYPDQSPGLYPTQDSTQDSTQDPNGNVQTPTAQLCVNFKDKRQSCVDLDNGINSQHDIDYAQTHWHKRFLSLSHHSTIDQIELTGGKHITFSINLGQIYIGEPLTLTTAPSAPMDIKLINELDERNPKYIHHVVQWQVPTDIASNTANTANTANNQYQFFNTSNKDFHVLIGVTKNSAMDFIDQNSSLHNICVRAVNLDSGLYSSCTPVS